ncbi:AAA family ATPase [Paenibacillus sp. GXUN7292]|uniref:AAA family ATPase n=1 Tax=Paenibacillus sp. GXUN7292 TaxID=3422499 RepID=UPI003D7C709E
MHGNYPIVVEDSFMSSTLVKEPFEYFEQASRFLIYIQESAIHSIAYFEKAVLFESNMAFFSLDRPSLPYYERVLLDAAKIRGYRISKKVDCEEGVLSNDVFMEVSRKDLIGQYVGWTAPIVAKLFEAAKGGTIFIDEAYSLMNNRQAGGYSEEALSEIIRQMENNPDTLVLFAGYPKEMKWFIEHANPGLRSRLTHTIEFKDYEAEELCGIFTYLASNEQMKVESMDEAHHCIRRFMQRMADLPSANLGNGRLMRRLFKTAISYMAERDDNDLQTLKTVDIELAEDEIWRAEHSIAKPSTSIGKIGFY